MNDYIDMIAGGAINDAIVDGAKLSGKDLAKIAREALSDAGFVIVPKEPSDAMIERAARAICNIDPTTRNWDDLKENTGWPNRYRDKAKAALKAAQEE